MTSAAQTSQLPRVRAVLALAAAGLAILLAAPPAGYAHPRHVRCAHVVTRSGRHHVCQARTRRKASHKHLRRGAGRGAAFDLAVPLPSLRRGGVRAARPSGSSSVAVPLPGAAESHGPAAGPHGPAGPRCGDGSTPVALGEETFACSDGGEPICEPGTQLSASEDASHLTCEPSQGGSSPPETVCEAPDCLSGEGGECGEAQVVRWRAQAQACEPADEVEA